MLTNIDIEKIKKIMGCKKEVFLSPDVISDGDPVKGCYKFAISSDNNFFKNVGGIWEIINIGSGDSFWAAGEGDSISNTNSGDIYINSPFRFESLITGQEQMLIIDNDGVVKVAPVPIPLANHFITSHNKFIKIAAGVIRPASGAAGQPIVWSFIDDAHHTKVFFESVSGSANNIVVTYPTIKKVVTFVAVPDESLASSTVQVGVSADVSSTNIVAYRLTMNAGRLTGNGSTAWVNSGLTTSVLSYNSGTGLTSITPTITNGNLLGASNEIEGTQIQYVGTNNYHIRRQYSGLGGIAGFYMVDNATNAIITGNLSTTDYIAIMFARPTVAAIPAETVAGNGYPAEIYNGNSNYWLHAEFETYMYSEPQSATSIKLEWQEFNIGGTFATNYRITRALNSAPGVETTIYNGAAFTFTDTGLTTGTEYYYRLYVTISAVESLLTYEIVSTL